MPEILDQNHQSDLLAEYPTTAVNQVFRQDHVDDAMIRVNPNFTSVSAPYTWVTKNRSGFVEPDEPNGRGGFVRRIITSHIPKVPSRYLPGCSPLTRAGLSSDMTFVLSAFVGSAFNGEGGHAVVLTANELSASTDLRDMLFFLVRTSHLPSKEGPSPRGNLIEVWSWVVARSSGPILGHGIKSPHGVVLGLTRTFLLERAELAFTVPANADISKLVLRGNERQFVVPPNAL